MHSGHGFKALQSSVRMEHVSWVRSVLRTVKQEVGGKPRPTRFTGERAFSLRNCSVRSETRVRIRDQCGARLQFYLIHFIFRVLPIRFGCTGAISSGDRKKQMRRIGVNEAFMEATIGFSVVI